MSSVRASAYLTVEASRVPYGTHKGKVRSAKVVRVTQGKPATLQVDQIAVKVTIELPGAAFDPLEPQAIIVVPEELIQHPVTVEASE